jgi:hypothetical protein
MTTPPHHDRYFEPEGCYRHGAPAEARDPRTIAPGRRGEITDRAWGGPRARIRA